MGHIHLSMQDQTWGVIRPSWDDKASGSYQRLRVNLVAVPCWKLHCRLAAMPGSLSPRPAPKGGRKGRLLSPVGTLPNPIPALHCWLLWKSVKQDVRHGCIVKTTEPHGQNQEARRNSSEWQPHSRVFAVDPPSTFPACDDFTGSFWFVFLFKPETLFPTSASMPAWSKWASKQLF